MKPDRQRKAGTTRPPTAASVKDQLRAEIARGRLKADDAVPSIADLMERYAIPRSAARKVVEDLLEEGVTYKRPGLGTFVANFDMMGRTRLCVLLRGIGIGGFFRSDSYMKDFLGGFAETATDRGYRMDVVVTQSESPAPFQDAVSSKRFGGFLVLPLPGEAQRSYLLHAAGQGAPMVFAFDRPEGAADWVDGDMETAACEAAHHLLAGGRSDLHLLDLSLAYASVAQRVRGFARAHGERGLTLRERQRIHLHDYWADIRAWTRTQLETLYGKDGGPNGLVLGGARPMAEAAMAFFAARGIRVPEEVAVVAFEDHPGYESMTPPLTAVQVPFFDLGREAARRLIAKIQKDENLEPCRPLPCPLVLRASGRTL